MKWRDKINLGLYDAKSSINQHYSFLRNVLRNSISGLIFSVVFIGLLLLLDLIARQTVDLIINSKFNVFNYIGFFFDRIKLVFGVKFIDFFKDVIVIVAGVLGVILGLFYTSFLNIITSKYSNINSAITNQLLEQKTINKYFRLLAILVSSSIVFQFLLIFGYRPTIISTILYTLAVLSALLSFIFFGRYALIYFNAGYLSYDLIDSCYKVLTRAFKNKKIVTNSSNSQQTLTRIKSNLYKVRLIVEESLKPQLSNTNLDEVSNTLLGFSIHFNSYKHTIPSNKGWHLKIQKYKKWDEVSNIEYDLYSRSGAMLYSNLEDDYFYIDKTITDCQFFIFENLQDKDTILRLTRRQSDLLQVISFQCENEYFQYYFDKVENLVKKNLIIGSNDVDEQNLQFCSLYINLLSNYFIGYAHYSTNTLSNENVKKLAKGIHSLHNTDRIIHFPYRIRVWLDNHQERLLKEISYENKVITPEFFTAFELASQFKHFLITHFDFIVRNTLDRINKLSNDLIESKHTLEALELLIEALDLNKKIEVFSEDIETKILEFDTFNLADEKSEGSKDLESLEAVNSDARETFINSIWELGLSSYALSNSDLPDIYGNFYQIISEDILDKSFSNYGARLVQFLPQFYKYNILYIQHLRRQIDQKNLEATASKVYPIIVDMFEISSIAVVISKAFRNEELLDSFWQFWDNSFGTDQKAEVEFWTAIITIYQHFSHPIYGMSTTSYMREQKRSDKLEEFIKKSELIRIEKMEDPYAPFAQKYISDIEDVYFTEYIRSISIGGISGLNYGHLSDIFIEYFLRTRISLSIIEIKETEYGSNLRRSLAGDSI